ncbi:MAG: RtcB family protein [Lachnospiraceae bacterium]|nr:RtcB family protein [Lachnospiraceae bacterium]
MIELKGKYNSCKVFTDNMDNETASQLTALLDQESVRDAEIRIMPDTHAGKGCVIGTTMTLSDKVIPNLVGVDIGCGMRAIRLEEKRIELPFIDSVIHNKVPSGFDIHPEAVAISNVKEIKADVNVDRAMRSLGTLGGGNHFIEIDIDKNGDYWLVIHTGSRHLGIEVCDYYQDKAYEVLKAQTAGGDIKELRKELIDRLTREGNKKAISKELKKLNDAYKNTQIDVPHDLAYVQDDDFKDYIHDMKLAQEHAMINRRTIADIILQYAKLHEVESFDTIHNYIDTENMILRKGAISARKDEKVLIPMNMRDGSLICIGKGNPDWNYSAPHGAGRIMSRSKARESISMDDFRASMDGIYTSCINQSTIDESAFAYKPMQEIIDNIQDTVEIVDIIKPIYNYKASE